MTETRKGPLPFGDAKTVLDETTWQACPGKGYHYADLNKQVFGHLPKHWLIGNVRKTFVGYSHDEGIRYKGASGGVITQILIYLLEKGMIDGAVVLKHGTPKPWLAESIIATTREEILAGAQSVYAPIPVNKILRQTTKFKGKLAYVGLPDQVTSIRLLQKTGHPSVQNIKYVLGPYVGINMYSGAVMQFAKSNGIRSTEEIQEVRYRDGEWPGYLRITSKSGKTVKAEKFYYNYLLPFFITQSTKLSIDFANDLTDISVGDAWNPSYEKEGKGFAVIAARTSKAVSLLEEMEENRVLHLEEKDIVQTMNMHGHMFDFKKRGTFVRMQFRKCFGKKNPDYGIKPESVQASRYLVECVISGVILICSNPVSRWILQFIPVSLIGRFFNVSRKSWKSLSKPTKRKGLLTQNYTILSE